VAALSVMEDLQVVEDRVGQLHSGAQRCRFNSSTCMRDQNASIMALS
jgi:hypothetical protein